MTAVVLFTNYNKKALVQLDTAGRDVSFKKVIFNSARIDPVASAASCSES